MSICDELSDLSDRQLLERVLRTAKTMLENVDQYIDDRHKETGSAEYALVHSTYYFTLRMFNIDRSSISYRLMEKIVECDPARVKDVCLSINKTITQNAAATTDKSTKPIVLEISIFYASTPASIIASLMDRFEFKHYRDTIVKEIFDEAWQNYRTNVDDFQQLIYLPETFAKTDSRKLEEVAYVIINMEKVMPITETTLLRDPQRKTQHYSLDFQNIQKLSYSFIEFLFGKFESVLQDVRFEYHGNSNAQITTTSLLVELLIQDPLQKSSSSSSSILDRPPLKTRQRSSSSSTTSKAVVVSTQPPPAPTLAVNTASKRTRDDTDDLTSRLFQPPLYSSFNKRQRMFQS